jgi:hypothetical protein
MSQRRELHQPDAINEIRHRGARYRQRQARFANAADPNERDNALRTHHLGHAALVLIASDERGGRLGHVVTADARRTFHQLSSTGSIR